MRQSIVEPGKYGMSAPMLAVMKAEIKVDTIPVHMHHEYITKKQMENNDEIPTGTVNAGHINKTTTLPLPTEEEQRQSTPKDNYLGYIQSISSSP